MSNKARAKMGALGGFSSFLAAGSGLDEHCAPVRAACASRPSATDPYSPSLEVECVHAAAPVVLTCVQIRQMDVLYSIYLPVVMLPELHLCCSYL